MTIQEAIKSGKPFKRKVDDLWLFLSPTGSLCIDKEIKVMEFGLTETDDILATDWEVTNDR